MKKRGQTVRDTWMRRCDISLFMSSKEDPKFPAVGLDVLPGRKHIASKAKAAWKYIYKHYLNEADFFVKADPDTYIIIENLKSFLSEKNPNATEYYGHVYQHKNWEFSYTAGGPGIVLTRNSVKVLVEEAFNIKPDCMPDGQGTTIVLKNIYLIFQ